MLHLRRRRIGDAFDVKRNEGEHIKLVTAIDPLPALPSTANVPHVSGDMVSALRDGPLLAGCFDLYADKLATNINSNIVSAVLVGQEGIEASHQEFRADQMLGGGPRHQVSHNSIDAPESRQYLPAISQKKAAIADNHFSLDCSHDTISRRWSGEAGESAGEESLSPALGQRLTWEEREDRRWQMEAGVRPWEEECV